MKLRRMTENRIRKMKTQAKLIRLLNKLHTSDKSTKRKIKRRWVITDRRSRWWRAAYQRGEKQGPQKQPQGGRHADSGEHRKQKEHGIV